MLRSGLVASDYDVALCQLTFKVSLRFCVVGS